jgi:soluble P-type ATPase
VEKSELQTFFEKISKMNEGEKAEIIVSANVKKEIEGIAKLGDMINDIGAMRFLDIWKRSKK